MLDPSAAQHRHPGQDKPKRPSSESSQSGLFFVAPRNPTPPPSYPEKDTVSMTSTATTSTEESVPGAIYATISPALRSSRRQMDAQLSLVSQHPIGPFPRVQSPTRLKSPSPDSAAAGGLQSPPSPSPPPPPPHPAPPPPDKGSPQAVANQHFIMVEVHQPNSEPDVNEVRPLPQARGGCCVMNHRMKKPSPGCSSREKTEADIEGRNWGGSWKIPPSGYRSLPEHQPCLQSIPSPSRDVRWQPWRGHGGKCCDFDSNSKSIGQGKNHRAWIDVMVGSRVFICFFFPGMNFQLQRTA